MYNSDYNSVENRGWCCPKCGKCYAPWVSVCPQCGGNSSPITNTPYIGEEWWREYLRTGDNTNPYPTVTLTGPVINCSEDELSWRDWLDEMRANYWKQEHLKEEND